MKCKHQNGIFSEYAIIENAKTVKNGCVSEIGENNIGNITGYIFECSDCDRKFKFQANPTRKFLKELYAQISVSNR